MEQSSRTSARPNPWDFWVDHDRLALPTVLLVEDDRDIREMVTTILEMAGLAVVACDTAEAGLSALREQQIDLVLTDYALPRRSGLWLLNEAESERLIEGTPVLIVTAHPNVQAAASYEIIQKPFDHDDLVDRVRQLIEDAGLRRSRPPVPVPGDSEDAVRNGHSNCPQPVELILYVSSESPRSFAAVPSIKKVLARLDASHGRLTVCDVAKEHQSKVPDAVGFPPALVRKGPGPRTFILGHITNPELLLELLADCDAEPH